MTGTIAIAELRAGAIDIAKRGWPVFPCAPSGKTPLTKHGLIEASADSTAIEMWWSAKPTANVAVRTGNGLVVLDVDGEAGADALAALERAQMRRLPPTVSVKTGNGQHYYFSHQGEIRNSAGLLGDHLDIRGDGGYVIAPPSVHPSGVAYQWDGCPGDVEVAPLPTWIVKLLSRPERRSATRPVSGSIPDGRRNDELASLAGSMRRRGMGNTEIAAALKVTNAERCRPPLDDREVEAIASSVARYEPASSAAQELTTDAKGKLILPETPSVDDTGGQCAWLTAVFGLDPRHPITGGVRRGVRGPEGCAVLTRAGAQQICFEPVRHISNPARLVEDLAWQTIKTDAAIPAIKAEHCRQIAHVLRMLCDTSSQLSQEQETGGLVGSYLAGAERVEGYTSYGTSAQRYEAADRIRRDTDLHSGRPSGAPRYLVDEHTGEFIIAVGELTDHARRFIGSSLARGWLDARMQGILWERIRLDGHEQTGRSGRSGPHLRIDAYRGLLPPSDPDPAVTT